MVYYLLKWDPLQSYEMTKCFYRMRCTISCIGPWLVANDVKSSSGSSFPRRHSTSSCTGSFSQNVHNNDLGSHSFYCSYLAPYLYMVLSRRKIRNVKQDRQAVIIKVISWMNLSILSGMITWFWLRLSRCWFWFRCSGLCCIRFWFRCGKPCCIRFASWRRLNAVDYK